MIESELSKDAQILIHTYMEGIKDLTEYVKEKIIIDHFGSLSKLSEITGTGYDTDKQKAIKITFLRMHALASSLCRLNHYLDVNAVANICRTLFELWLDIEYIYFLDEEDIAIKKFHNFSLIKRWFIAKETMKLELIQPDLKNQSILNSEIREKFVSDKELKVKELSQNIWGQEIEKFHGLTHWSGFKIEKRIQNVNSDQLSFENQTLYEYKETYQLLNSYVHSGPEGFQGFSPDGFKALFGNLMALSRDKYVLSLQRTVTIYELNITSDVFKEKIEKLKNIHIEKFADLIL